MPIFGQIDPASPFRFFCGKKRAVHFRCKMAFCSYGNLEEEEEEAFRRKGSKQANGAHAEKEREFIDIATYTATVHTLFSSPSTQNVTTCLDLPPSRMRFCCKKEERTIRHNISLKD